jgi:hypothetical protein
MNSPRAVFLLLLSVCCASRLAAQNFTDLKDLKQLKVVVEELDADAERAGVTKEALQSQVLAALKRDLPQVGLKDSAVSYVYVRVITSFRDNWCAIRVVLQLWRPVIVMKDDGDPIGPTLANVRERGTTLAGPAKAMGPKVLEEVSTRITELAADFKQANPEPASQ